VTPSTCSHPSDLTTGFAAGRALAGSSMLLAYAEPSKIGGMAMLYRRPAGAARLNVEPQLASWDRAGSPGQLRLANFLAHVDATAAPMVAAAAGRLSVELIVGLPSEVALTGGGRDLDNYLYPVAQRLGPPQVAAMFGRKIHGPSSLAVSPAELNPAMTSPQFSTRITGSYARKEWKETLRARLLQAQTAAADPGPVAMNIAVTTGPGRNWASLWKPLIDSFGPVLGEDPSRPFNPHDDRILDLGLHHHISTGIGYDVIIDAWWQNL
jgi:hypothetical protein